MISGILSPIKIAIKNEPVPEKIPFKNTISYVLLSASFLVQLFSSPQQQVADITNNEPIENLKLPVPSNERTILDIVIKTMSHQSLNVTQS